MPNMFAQSLYLLANRMVMGLGLAIYNVLVYHSIVSCHIFVNQYHQ